MRKKKNVSSYEREIVQISNRDMKGRQMKEAGNKSYVNNGKISSRQTMRLYVFDLMGIATLLLPPYLAMLCGVNGIYAILLGTAVGLLYLFYLGWVMKQMKMDLTTFLHEQIPVWLGKLVFFFIFIHSILTAGFCAYVFANLMQYSLVQDVAYGVILFLIVTGAAYAVSGGIESRARVYEVLFWIVLVPYFIMMLASVRNVKWSYVAPALQWDGTNLGKATYLVFLLLTPLFFSLFLIGEKEKNYGRNIVKTVSASILFSGGILLVSYVLLLGNFGVKSLADLRFPVVTLMSTIQFEGNFLKRMDALMLAVWFFTLYALLNLHLHYGVRMFAELGKRRMKQKKLKWWQAVLPAMAVFLIAYNIYLEEKWMRGFLSYYAYVAVPFMVLLPIVLLTLRRKKQTICVVLLMTTLFLTGCSSTELEERCFPMLVAAGFEDGKITYGAGFPKSDASGQSNSTETEIKMPIVSEIDFMRAMEKFESRINKEVDYNHLKIFVIEEELLEKSIAYNVMLQYLAETERFPRNTYVCVVDDIEDLYELEKNISQDTGTYLEEYLKQHEENKDRLLTLGDLIDEQKNQTMILYLPYFGVEENYVEWKGYVNTSGKMWQESE